MLKIQRFNLHYNFSLFNSHISCTKFAERKFYKKLNKYTTKDVVFKDL